MISFHGDPKIKAKYLKRIRAHIKADHLIRGEGWDGTKGCAVGCTLEKYDHKAYEVELGIPEWLARVEDALFENMTLKKSYTWPELFLKSINPGVNLEPVKAKFLIMVLESALTSFDHAKFPNVKACLDGSITLWKRKDIGSKKWNEAAEAAAEAAAWAAAEAAVVAAWAARAAARAAAMAAEAAVVAAEAAARAAAWAAAWAAATVAEYDCFADELIKILEETKCQE